MSGARTALCPSARCDDGAYLIGVVTEAGAVSLLHEPIEMTAEHCRAAHEGRNPHSRFRFASPCQTRRCTNWSDKGGCGLIGRVQQDVDAIRDKLSSLPLRSCAIRDRCLWHNQLGKAACDVCTLVVTDIVPERRSSQSA